LGTLAAGQCGDSFVYTEAVPHMDKSLGSLCAKQCFLEIIIQDLRHSFLHSSIKKLPSPRRPRTKFLLTFA
jgi:hypothetical protein